MSWHVVGVGGGGVNEGVTDVGVDIAFGSSVLEVGAEAAAVGC
jgi:hypothetical protein